MNFDPEERMGLSISISNGYRTRRPKRRPKKTWGHGVVKLLKPWRDRLRDKKEVAAIRPVAVPQVSMPKFLEKMLALRPEARRILTPELYALSSNKNGSKQVSPPILQT